MQTIKAVLFDVFGTLASIGNKRRPYVQLLHYLAQRGRLSQPEDGAKLMSHNVGLAGAAALLGESVPLSFLATLEQELFEELGSISLYPDVLPTLQSLHTAGYQIGICSNLAAPYAVPVRALLPFNVAQTWSFSCGYVKPQEGIYAHACAMLDCNPAEILMVGDTFDADYEGPRRFGMQSVHLVRKGSVHSGETISTLAEIPLLLQKSGS